MNGLSDRFGGGNDDDDDDDGQPKLTNDRGDKFASGARISLVLSILWQSEGLHLKSRQS